METKEDKAMAKMLARAERMHQREQRKLANMKATATVNKGRVKARMNGHRTLLSMHIDPELLADPDQRHELEDMIVEAINKATDQIDEKLGSPFGTLESLPGLFADFFDSPLGPSR